MAPLAAGLYAITVLLSAYALKTGVGTPPPSAKSSLPEEERAKNMDFSPMAVVMLVKTWKLTEYLTFAITLCEAGASFFPTTRDSLQQSSPNNITSLCPKDRIFDPQTQFPILAWSGCIVLILGSTLRVWSIRSLGKFFTYQVSIRPDHKLYTDGPYTIVRHPSYTGFTFIVLGQVIFLLSGGTFTHECLKWTFPSGFQVIRAILLCQAAIAMLVTLTRITREDALLKKHFGDEWIAWAEKTRYCLLPGIF